MLDLIASIAWWQWLAAYWVICMGLTMIMVRIGESDNHNPDRFDVTFAFVMVLLGGIVIPYSVFMVFAFPSLGKSKRKR